MQVVPTNNQSQSLHQIARHIPRNQRKYERKDCQSARLITTRRRTIFTNPFCSSASCVFSSRFCAMARLNAVLSLWMFSSSFSLSTYVSDSRCTSISSASIWASLSPTNLTKKTGCEGERSEKLAAPGHNSSSSDTVSTHICEYYTQGLF